MCHLWWCDSWLPAKTITTIRCEFRHHTILKHTSKVHTNRHTEMKDHKHQKASSVLFLWKPKAPKAPKCVVFFFWFSLQEQCCKRFTKRERERPDQRSTQGLASPLDSKPKSSTPAIAACRSAKKKNPKLCAHSDGKKENTQPDQKTYAARQSQSGMHSSLSTRQKHSLERKADNERELWLQTTWRDGFSQVLVGTLWLP